MRFVSPTTIKLSDCLEALRCEDCEDVDAQYTVELLTTPLVPGTTPVYKDGSTDIFLTDKGCLRIYSPLTHEDGCQVACLLCKDGNNTLYYPAARWDDYYRKYWHCAHLIAGEELLSLHKAVLLHSSVVEYDGKAVLFSGPSGAGKSTQADLWKRHLGAEIINGDRCVIMERDGAFFGGGSLWCGSSGIYSPKQLPIAGIFILRHGDENRATRLYSRAFAPLFSQTTLNSWNNEFMNNVTDIYSKLIETIPVYELECRADEDAVLLAESLIFPTDTEKETV